MKQKFFDRIFKLILSVALLLSCVAVVVANSVNAHAAAEGNTAQPNGIYTNISVSIYGGGGTVTAKAKNKFTLGKSTVTVYIELYSSESYCTDHSLMRLESSNYIYDLDQGKTIETSALTAGRQRYWLARLRYKQDSKEWVYKNTETILCDGNGNLL